jgi:hypothetical protein
MKCINIHSVLLLLYLLIYYNYISHTRIGGRRGHDRMIVGFITTYAISAYHHSHCEFEPCSGEVYSIQHYLIKFVSDLQQVSGFLQVLRFPPPIELTATI